MNYQNLNTPAVTGIILGLIVTLMLIVSPTPPAFALAVGIIFGVVAFFVLNENKKER